MNNTSEITSLFNYIINNKDSVKIVTLLNKMLEGDIINEEIFLNLIKALILIFHLDISYFDIYYKLFCYILYKMNEEIQVLLFDKIKKLNLSEQIYLSDYLIENIIIYTNKYIIQNFIIDSMIDMKIMEWINIINIIGKCNTSIYMKCYIYLYIIKQKNKVTIMEVNTIINTINKFIG